MCGCGKARNVATQTVTETQQQTSQNQSTTDTQPGQRVGDQQKIPARS